MRKARIAHRRSTDLSRKIIEIAQKEHKSARQIAKTLGISSGHLIWLLKREGVDLSELRDLHCDYCGVLLRSATLNARYGKHACKNEDCRRQYRNELARLRRRAEKSALA